MSIFSTAELEKNNDPYTINLNNETIDERTLYDLIKIYAPDHACLKNKPTTKYKNLTITMDPLACPHFEKFERQDHMIYMTLYIKKSLSDFSINDILGMNIWFKSYFHFNEHLKSKKDVVLDFLKYLEIWFMCSLCIKNKYDIICKYCKNKFCNDCHIMYHSDDCIFCVHCIKKHHQKSIKYNSESNDKSSKSDDDENSTESDDDNSDSDKKSTESIIMCGLCDENEAETRCEYCESSRICDDCCIRCDLCNYKLCMQCIEENHGIKCKSKKCSSYICAFCDEKGKKLKCHKN